MKSQTMKFQLKFLGALTLGLMTCFSLTNSAHAQENDENQIEIVDQNGDPVKPSAIRVQAEAKAGGGGAIFIAGGLQRNQDGKIIVKDKDGNQREIDTNGARSIIINESVETVNNNGKEETKRVGKAIIIGPDGQRHEIDLGGNDGLMQKFDLPFGTATAQRSNDGFMIGVYCEPVSPALQAQLQLDSESGLTVVRITPDSPAQRAGIVKHDILMFADDRQLSKQSDLTEAVQIAGKEKTKISMTLIRGGKEISAEVTPVERTAADISVNVMPELLRVFPEMGKPGGLKMQFRQMGPGVILDKGFGGAFDNKDMGNFEQMHKDMEERMEAMQKRVEELHLQMRKELEDR